MTEPGIPRKPEGSTWTDDQWKAIVTEGRNILVAAAAGSGKTAVLVERIIRKISADTDVDRLLVATFTKAAAAEMKERIRIALEKELDKNPGSDHLRRQLALMGRASITTLHSFCLDVIRRYYSLIGLDPGFRIASETEAELLRIDVLDELFEELYAAAQETDALPADESARADDAGEASEAVERANAEEADDTGEAAEVDGPASAEAPEDMGEAVEADGRASAEEAEDTGEAAEADGPASAEAADESGQNWLPEPDGFLELVERFGGERGDEPLYRLVLKLHNFAQSHPWPEYWLHSMADSFDIADAEELGCTEWAATIRRQVELGLAGAEHLLEQALELTRRPAGPAAYAATFDDDLALVRSLSGRLLSEPWEAWSGAFADIAFGKLKSMRGDDFDKTLQEQAKELREKAKEAISDLKEELFGRTSGQFAKELRELAPLMWALAALVVAFGARFEKAKREKGLLDFGDMEHYCLRILRDPASTPETTLPSAAALEYQRQFDEILLDEYQDTNMVQEAIVSLLARPGLGNRFMVGDVKQSIYRFRLAEPNLFMRKYKTYAPAADGEAPHMPPGGALVAARPGDEGGARIDLARNFRSRQEVVDGVNGVFRAIMREQVAEMDYDERAELVCGASYPPAGEGGAPERYAIEFAVLDKGAGPEQTSVDDSRQEEDGEQAPDEAGAAEPPEDLQTVQLEARYIAAQILRLRGAAGGSGFGAAEKPFEPFDGRKGSKRPLAWRDIVILLRADKQWAPIIIEELQAQGIPAYAELSSGYFEATEVETMLSLLRVIDNPYQDIPLAGALRSPIFGLTAEELALVRIVARNASYYEAVKLSAGEPAVPEETRLKLSAFLTSLESWREEARQGAVAELLWRLYRDTGYLDLVGGMPGGLQRQANLRALHDRARQYESSSLRGLFRFLRFIDRMRENGGDLGTARALGEQEDVVRIMSIHKSKGLEFPVVFVAGLGKTFNRQDLNSPFLMHKQLGFGPRFVDTALRVSYPTLPHLAIRERLRMESLAEEMRILYVALTRPKEKMFLVGTVADADKQVQRWLSSLDGEGRLPDFRLSQAKRFLDWIAPLALAEGLSLTVEKAHPYTEEESAAEAAEEQWHPAGAESAAEEGADPDAAGESGERAETSVPDAGLTELETRRTGGTMHEWKSGVVPASALGVEAAPAAELDAAAQASFAERLQAVRALVPIPTSPQLAAELERRFAWRYPFAAATTVAAKTSVTEMKRLHAEFDEDAAMLPLPSEPDGEAWEASGPNNESADAGPGGADLILRAAGPNRAETEPNRAASESVRAAFDPAQDEAAAGLEQLSFLFDEPEPGSDSPLRDGTAHPEENAVGEASTDPGEKRTIGGTAVMNAASERLPFEDESSSGLSGRNGNGAGGAYTFRLRRPKFMEEASLTAAERGTVSHLVMQHIPLDGREVDVRTVQETIEGLRLRRMLTAKQAGVVDAAAVAAFFRQPVGRRLLRAEWVRRETPFSCTFPAERVYPGSGAELGGEPILIQGVIDCLFRDESGLVLLDYKTDRIVMKRWEQAAERHRFQLSLYAEAIGRILGEPVGECYVFFFDGGQAVKLFG